VTRLFFNSASRSLADVVELGGLRPIAVTYDWAKSRLFFLIVRQGSQYHSLIKLMTGLPTLHGGDGFRYFGTTNCFTRGERETRLAGESRLRILARTATMQWAIRVAPDAFVVESGSDPDITSRSPVQGISPPTRIDRFQRLPDQSLVYFGCRPIPLCVFRCDLRSCAVPWERNCLDDDEVFGDR